MVALRSKETLFFFSHRTFVNDVVETVFPVFSLPSTDHTSCRNSRALGDQSELEGIEGCV